MDYEKEYKKLKADIEKAYLFAQTDSTKAVLEHILPELRKSEDERIREELIEKVKETPACIGFSDKNAVLTWLEKQGQKPAWTEADDEELKITINALKNIGQYNSADWLITLKQRYTWKPSKEQMDAMQMAVSYFDDSWTSKEQKFLESLYKDLKKL